MSGDPLGNRLDSYAWLMESADGITEMVQLFRYKCIHQISIKLTEVKHE